MTLCGCVIKQRCLVHHQYNRNSHCTFINFISLFVSLCFDNISFDKTFHDPLWIQKKFKIAGNLHSCARFLSSLSSYVITRLVYRYHKINPLCVLPDSDLYEANSSHWTLFDYLTGGKIFLCEYLNKNIFFQ